MYGGGAILLFLACIGGAIKNDEFSKIEVDAENGFTVNGDDLKRFMETTMTKHPMLFKKSAPKFHDATPGSQIGAKKDVSQMTTAELLNEYKNLAAKG